MSDVVNRLCKGIVDSKDDLIKAEITKFIGSDWSIEGIKGRAELLLMPDGSEIFKLDGVELIQFMKAESSVNTDGVSYMAKANQSYRLLR